MDWRSWFQNEQSPLQDTNPFKQKDTSSFNQFDYASMIRKPTLGMAPASTNSPSAIGASAFGAPQNAFKPVQPKSFDLGMSQFPSALPNNQDGIYGYIQGGPQGTRALRVDQNQHANPEELLNPSQVDNLTASWGRPTNYSAGDNFVGMSNGMNNNGNNLVSMQNGRIGNGNNIDKTVR